MDQLWLALSLLIGVVVFIFIMPIFFILYRNWVDFLVDKFDSLHEKGNKKKLNPKEDWNEIN